MNYKTDIEDYLTGVKTVIDELDTQAIDAAMSRIAAAFSEERVIYIFGNGGSAATASHFANDFNKGISEYTDKKFRFMCLNDNIATLMAIANDISYDEVFRFQLIGRLSPGDLVIGISGSGNSANVLNAVNYANSRGNDTIGITGLTGGELMRAAKYPLHVPSMSMQVTEDLHMIFDHLMMAVFLKHLAGIEHIRQ